VIEPKIFPALSKEVLARLTKQALEQDDRVAAATLFMLAGRPKTFKVWMWPRVKGAGEFEIGVN
jgi:hypothetical protein